MRAYDPCCHLSAARLASLFARLSAYLFFSPISLPLFSPAKAVWNVASDVLIRRSRRVLHMSVVSAIPFPERGTWSLFTSVFSDLF